MSGRVSQGTNDVVDAAARVAGTIAARGRGDVDGARELLASFEDHEELANGSLLVADMALRALADQTGQSIDECVSTLTLRLLSIRE